MRARGREAVVLAPPARCAMSRAADASEIWRRDRGGDAGRPRRSVGSERIFSQFGLARAPRRRATPSSGHDLVLEAALGARPEARSCDSTANSSMSSRRDVPLLGDQLGAAELADLLVAVARQPALASRRTGLVKPNVLGRPSSPSRSGSSLMFCTPPATTRSVGAAITACAAKCTACCDEPHWRSTVVPGTCSGQPGGEPAGAGDVAGLRADGVDAAEDDVLDRAGVDAGAVDQRLERCARPGRRGGRAARPPPRRPTGVRTASTM